MFLGVCDFLSRFSILVFVSLLVFQGRNPQPLPLLHRFFLHPRQVPLHLFHKSFLQGNCSTRHFGGNLVQLVIVRGLAGFASTCARFFLNHCPHDNFCPQANDHALLCPNYRPPDALDWLRRLGGPGQAVQEEEEDENQEPRLYRVTAEARGKGNTLTNGSHELPLS